MTKGYCLVVDDVPYDGSINFSFWTSEALAQEEIRRVEKLFPNKDPLSVIIEINWDVQTKYDR